MIGTVIRHYMLDIGIGILFDNLKANLFIDKPKPSMVGMYVYVTDHEDNYVTDGIITGETDHMFFIQEEEYVVEIPINVGGYKFEYSEEEISDKQLAEWLYFKVDK